MPKNQQMQALQDPDFAHVPPGSIPAARSGGYRHDHQLLAAQTYKGPQMQQQRQDTHPDNVAQQMRMQTQL